MGESWQGVDLLSSGLYVVKVDRDPWTLDLSEIRQRWLGSMPRFEPFREVLRDANARDGEWSAVVRLEHDVAEFELEGDRPVVVPVFRPDPERATWTRRKWWGRGPLTSLWWCGCSTAWCSQPIKCVPF